MTLKKDKTAMTLAKNEVCIGWLHGNCCLVGEIKWIDWWWISGWISKFLTTEEGPPVGKAHTMPHTSTLSNLLLLFKKDLFGRKTPVRE